MKLNKEQKKIVEKIELALYESNEHNLVKYLKEAQLNKIPKDAGLAAHLFPALLKVVLNGWKFGWDVFYKNFPSVLLTYKDDDFPIIWEIACIEGHLFILKDMEKLGANLIQEKDGKGRNSVHVLFDSIAIQRIYPTENQKVIEMVKWFKENGLNIYEAYPGFYGENDSLKSGHALWDYAIRSYNWNLAIEVLPETWEEVNQSKRWKEQIPHLHDIIKKNQNMSTDLLWLLWLERFFEHWYYSPLQFSTLHEIKLLTGVFIKSNNKHDHSKYWEIINYKNVSNRTWWHVIVQNPEDDNLFENIIKLANEDNISIKEKLFEKDLSGVRPIDNLIMYYKINNLKISESKWNSLLIKVLQEASKEELEYKNEIITESIEENMKD